MAFYGNYIFDFEEVFLSSTRMNHMCVIFLSFTLSASFLLHFGYKIYRMNEDVRRLFSVSSVLRKCSGTLNCLLGVIYLGIGLWMVEENVMKGINVYPLHQWLSVLSESMNMLVSVFLISIRTAKVGSNFVRIWSLVTVFVAGFICASSIICIIIERKLSVKIFLDLLLIPAALFLILCAFSDDDSNNCSIDDESLYEPLSGTTMKSNKNNNDQDVFVTRFATAGIVSKLSFWWLNPLLKKGYQSPLEEKDMQMLRYDDRAQSCYSLFSDTLNKKRETHGISSPSRFWIIVLCYRKEIIVSGLFALLKIITVSAGPVLINAFIKVSEGKEFFKYDGYVLALGLFCAKCLESLSQRQWFFRTRKLGLQVRSLLSAAIYDKQLKLSNSAKLMHSSGEIMNYVTVDASRIGEFPFWLHQTWTTCLQLCISLVIVYNAVGLATISTMVVIVLTVVCNAPVAKLQHKFQTKLMQAQDVRLKAVSEALANMKILKLYAWETNYKKVIQGLREDECKWLKASNLRRAYISFLFWSSPVLVSAATFLSCYFLGVPLYPSNVFTFVATLRLVQDPVRQIPNVLAVVIQAKVSFERIIKFLDAPELQIRELRKKYHVGIEHPVMIKSCSFSWEDNNSKPTLRNINLEIKAKDKVAICGEVGSGKSTLLAAILGEIPKIEGMIQVCGKIAYVSQTAWIQSGTLRDNILFGSVMDTQRYQETLENCSLIKDLEMLPHGDLTEIGDRGINLSGGQKQRIQLARALYKDADIYLLDDPFSAVDAHTATSLFNEYVMGALTKKTVLLVTHRMEFLPSFDSILLMSDGETIGLASYVQLLASSRQFQELVEAQKDIVDTERPVRDTSNEKLDSPSTETVSIHSNKHKKLLKSSGENHLIRKEEKERGDTGLKPYMQYLNQNKGYLYASIAILCHIIFIAGQVSQNSWMAANVQNPRVSTLQLITIYLSIGFSTTLILLGRSLFIVALGLQSSRSLFAQLLTSIFRAPMSFFDSTPVGRILSRVSADLNIVDLDVPFTFIFTICATLNVSSNLVVLAVVTWPVLFISIPMIFMSIWLQKYYLTSAKELMRINGTTKSLVANHLAESIAGTVTIRAFEEEDRFLAKNLKLIDKNASPFFHNFAAREWLIQRLETMSAAILSSSALIMALLPKGTFSSGFVGMALSYGLSLNISLVGSIQNQCILSNYIISVERLNQYMHIESEAPEVIEENRPPADWPAVGTIVLHDLKIRYRPDTPLVLHGISCTIIGGNKVGIVGRTGSGKTTLISALFRLVEPAEGKIIIDGLNISTIGLHDLRSRLGIIPQDPALFQGSIRYNLDPLGQFTDQHIWEVLEKCQLQEAVREKELGLDSLVVEDGSNWSTGQRQLFCLGRALLRKSNILILDEATASIDNATDAILQKNIRSEFADCTVITVAHRIPTVMDCNMVLAISDGKMVEYDDPLKLMKNEESLFGKLVREYWSTSQSQIM